MDRFITLLSFSSLLLVLVLLPTYSHSQITKIPFQDENIGGYEFLEFRYPNSEGYEVIDSFDIVANNPFNNLAYLKSVNLRVNQTIPIDFDDLSILQSDFGCEGVVNSKSSRSKWGSTGTQVFRQNNSVILTYNLFVYTDDGDALGQGGRFSSIIVLNSHGDVINRVDRISTDAFMSSISENMRYLAYGFGQGLYAYDGENIERGFEIIDLQTGLVHYQIEVDYVQFVSSIYNMIVITYNDRKVTREIVLDTLTGCIYDSEAFSMTLGRFLFMQSDGTILQLDDLIEIIR